MAYIQFLSRADSPGSLDRRQVVMMLVVALSPRIALAAAAAQAQQVPERDIQVERVGHGFTVDMDTFFPVSQPLVWAVLTDYEHMSEFVPNLTSSEVTDRTASGLTVTQKGVARYGPFSSAFESMREIRLTAPSEIRSRGIGGTLKRMESWTRLSHEGSGTRLTYHTEVVPGVWFPPIVGPSVVREQTARQFSAMLGEMLRRDVRS